MIPKRDRAKIIVAALTIWACSAPATVRAYDAATTHPGLTSMAALESRIHGLLRSALGLELGLFEPLQLHPEAMDRRALHLLRQKLRRLDPAGGYRPDGEVERQTAIGWLMAGSVLADMPASANRHHFYSPVLRRGLDDRAPLRGFFYSLLSTLEGGDSLRDLLTASGFDLTGHSAVARATGNASPHSAPVFYLYLQNAISAASPLRRQHELVRALLALGGLLHLLQDMAVPAQVRNDFRGAQVQKLGGSLFDRGPAYERAVALLYAQHGLPDARGRAAPRFGRLRDFFTNRHWNGLADITAKTHFSAGTLPPDTPLALRPDTGALRRRLQAKLRFSEPPVGALDLDCARQQVCYQHGPHGPQLAYRIDRRRKRLRFSLDLHCLRATAEHLLPLALRYSVGLLDFLLRGQLALTRDGGQMVVRSRGVAIGSAKLQLLWEDEQGTRHPLHQQTVTAVDADEPLAELSLEPPQDAERVIALITGTDQSGEPLVATAQLSLVAAEPAEQRAAPPPVWSEPASPPASQPTSQPASAPASQPAAGPASAPATRPINTAAGQTAE